MKMHNPPHPGDVLRILCLEPLIIHATILLLMTGCASNKVDPDFMHIEWMNREDVVAEKLLEEGIPPEIIIAHKRTYDKYLFLTESLYHSNVEKKELIVEYEGVGKKKFQDISYLKGKKYFGLKLKESNNSSHRFTREQLDPRTRLFVQEEIDGTTYWTEYLVMREDDRYPDIFGTEAVWQDQKTHPNNDNNSRH